MKAWQLSTTDRTLRLVEREVPPALPGSVVVRMQAVPLLGYLADYVRGELPYQYPARPFVVGTNGVGTVEAVGEGVHHFVPGQPVLLHPYLVADENVDEPAEILMGLTGTGPASAALLDAWPDGTLAEYVRVPASVPVSLAGLERLSWPRLATLAKFLVPFGGLRRGRLAAGETLVVNGATGYFGSAAAMLGLAMGAARVVVAGRDAGVLQGLVALDPRLIAVALEGDVERDTAALREAAGGGAQLAFDMVGRAGDANATLATLGALQRRGRMVLMGSMQAPLPLDYGQLLINQWELIGHFMYRPQDARLLVALVRSGQLDLERVGLRDLPFDQLHPAMTAATAMKGLDCTVVAMAG